MAVHKIIDSPAAAKLLPFARTRAKLMSGLPYYASQTYKVNGVTARISHDPGANAQFIRLMVDKYGVYEFFTSDAMIFEGGLGTPPYTGGANGSYCCGHTVRVSASSGAVGIGSWTGLNNVPYTTANDGAAGLKLQCGFNNTKRTFRQSWTTHSPAAPSPVDVKDLVTLSVDCHKDNTLPWFARSSQEVYRYARVFGDTKWDLRQSVYSYDITKPRDEQISAPRIATPLLGAPNWWRRGTTVLVGDAKVRVSIVTDAYNNFHFFKTDSLPTDPNLNVLTSQGLISYIPVADRVTVTQASYMPAWAALASDATLVSTPGSPGQGVWTSSLPPSTASYTSDAGIPYGDAWSATAPATAWYQTNQVLWNFRSDGLKAVGIVGYDRGARYMLLTKYQGGDAPTTYNDGVTWGTGAATSHYVTEAMRTPRYATDPVGSMHIPSDVEPYFDTGLGFAEARIVTPALLEVNISVSISPEGALSASVTVAQSDNTCWYVDADYAYNHPSLVAKGVSGGDLVTGVVECYTAQGDSDTRTFLADFPYRCHVVGVYKIRKGISPTSTPLIEFAVANTANTFERTLASGVNGLGPVGADYVMVEDKYANVPKATYVNPSNPSDTVQIPVYGGYYYNSGTGEYTISYLQEVNGLHVYDCNMPLCGGMQATCGGPLRWTDSAHPNYRAFFTTIAECDLRSLSLVVQTLDNGGTTAPPTITGLVVYRHGDIVSSQGNGGAYFDYLKTMRIAANKVKIFPSTTEVGVAVALAADGYIERFGTDYRGFQNMNGNIYSAVHSTLASMLGEYGNGANGAWAETVVSTSPDGSVAMYHSNNYGLYDVITYSVEVGGVLETFQDSHMRCFNASYEQTRGYEAYGTETATYKYGAFCTSSGWL